MEYVLVKFKDNYADEFDLNGFRIMPKDEWQDYVDNVKKIPWPQAIYFGTNEGIQYDSCDKYLECFTILDITSEEKDILDSLFFPYRSKYSFAYGHFLDFDDDWKYIDRPTKL